MDLDVGWSELGVVVVAALTDDGGDSFCFVECSSGFGAVVVESGEGGGDEYWRTIGGEDSLLVTSPSYL